MFELPKYYRFDYQLDAMFDYRRDNNFDLLLHHIICSILYPIFDWKFDLPHFSFDFPKKDHSQFKEWSLIHISLGLGETLLEYIPADGEHDTYPFQKG